ncbi:MAG: PKD domain-containing protein [Euryarchaeota archaeon]|nr:PKD domain-containing protein [Euryarchaeota archaeon]
MKNIKLYKGGGYDSTITSSTSNDGSYYWDVSSTQTPGSDYMIKITSISNPSVNDYSDNHFLITEHITAFSFSGPMNKTACSGVWTDWYHNATHWFNTMGYHTENMVYPNEVKVKSHIQSYEIAMFYEVGHSRGNSYEFRNNCSDTTTADEIHEWIEDYPKMPFTFLASCKGMCDTGPDTLSYEFRKGLMKDTVTVGYCGMGEAPCNKTCWRVAVDWQDALFNYMNQGRTVKTAFNQAVADYPDCDGCVRFAGDPNFEVVPVVRRGIVAIPKSDHKYNNAGLFPTYPDGSQSYGHITEYRWDFGDGEVECGETVERIYSTYRWIGGSSGHYEPFDVSLTVKDNEGNSDTINTDVNVYIVGDVNGDGEVNILDAVLAGKYWRATCGGCGDYVWDDEGADRADLNNDCDINILDSVIIGANWRKTAW